MAPVPGDRLLPAAGQARAAVTGGPPSPLRPGHRWPQSSLRSRCVRLEEPPCSSVAGESEASEQHWLCLPARGGTRARKSCRMPAPSHQPKDGLGGARLRPRGTGKAAASDGGDVGLGVWLSPLPDPPGLSWTASALLCRTAASGACGTTAAPVQSVGSGSGIPGGPLHKGTETLAPPSVPRRPRTGSHGQSALAHGAEAHAPRPGLGRRPFRASVLDTSLLGPLPRESGVLTDVLTGFRGPQILDQCPLLPPATSLGCKGGCKRQV